ncbi:MAG TPA: hydrogenase maturation protease [Polyangia bacterium]
MDTRVLCLGNELVRDDGVGIRVGRILMELSLPPDVRIELAPHLGFDLIEVVAGADQVVLVDAMSTGRAPGTCVTMKGTAIERYSAGAAASHTIGIAELMALAHRLAPARGPAALHFVGVEGVSFEEYGLELSPAVEAALPAAVEAVLRVLGANAALLTAGREASLRAMHGRPTLTTLLGRPAIVK